MKNQIFDYEKTKMQISCAVIPPCTQSFKILLFFCESIGGFVLDLVANPKDRFSLAALKEI